MKNKTFSNSQKLCYFLRHWILCPLPWACLFYTLNEGGYMLAMYLLTITLGVPDGNNPDYFHLSLPFDAWMPFVKEFIIPYVFAFGLWFVGPFLIYGFMGRKRFFQFMVMGTLVAIFSFVFFLIVPNEVHDSFLGNHINEHSNNIFDKMVYQIYEGIQNNEACAAPSGHWSDSIMVAIGLRAAIIDKEASKTKKGVAWGCMIFAIFVCASTIFVKEHYIFDGILSIIFCELCWFIAKKTPIANKWEGFVMNWNLILGISSETKIAKPKKTIKVIAWIAWIILVIAGLAGVFETNFDYSQFPFTFSFFIILIIVAILYYLIPSKKEKKLFL